MIQAVFMIEMMGKPKDYLKTTLSEYIDKIGEEKVKILRKDIAEPKEIENDLFSTFAEIEVETQELVEILKIIFSYMPSHMEVIKPETISLKNADFNSMANEILMRLHKYDEIAKTLSTQKTILENQLKQLGVKPAIYQMQPNNVPQETQKKEKKPKKKKKSKKK